MRQLTIKADNTEVSVSSWNTYINDKTITDVIANNMEHGSFRAKVTIIIEEVDSDITIQSNKPEPEPTPEPEPEELESPDNPFI